jgi:hypothetical protein
MNLALATNPLFSDAQEKRTHDIYESYLREEADRRRQDARLRLRSGLRKAFLGLAAVAILASFIYNRYELRNEDSTVAQSASSAPKNAGHADSARLNGQTAKNGPAIASAGNLN